MRATFFILSAVVMSGVFANGVEAAPKAGRAAIRHGREIRLADGLYMLQDRTVTCKVARGAIDCANGRVEITCIGYRCTAYHDGQPDPALALPLDYDLSQARKVLAPGTEVRVENISCDVTRHYIACELPDVRGGFQMSNFFARNSTWDDAPPGWPWNGRHYTSRDVFPFPL